MYTYIDIFFDIPIIAVGLDVNLLVPELVRQGIVVRGLGHPIHFVNNGRDELGGRVPGLGPKRTGNILEDNPELFRRFGALPVTPKNYYRLMETGQNVLLFPGGHKEVFHGRGDEYKLFWPEKVDFVRTAAKFNATIVPVCAVGIPESLRIIADSKEAESIPFLFDSYKELISNSAAARFDTAAEDEYFLPPLVAPGLPSRNYFVFGRALETKSLDPKDKEACKEVYQKLKDEIYTGLDAIRSAREKDPYKDAPRRLAYERFMGKKAPTFDISEMAKGEQF